MKCIEYEILKPQMKLYEKIFDIVRVVDPIKMRVIGDVRNGAIINSFPCYSIWKNDKEFSYFISVEVLNEQKTFVKVQHNFGKVFLVIAAPLKLYEKKLVLELIKDITNDFLFETVYQDQGYQLQNIVQDLNMLIIKDALTNLFNRQYIDKKLPEEIARCESQRPLSIAVADIDNFNNINDFYGYSTGDLVLKKISDNLSELIKSDEDWAARYGGDEFLLCLPDTDDKKAFKVIERIRKAIEKMSIRIGEEEIQITCSFGLCTLKGNYSTAADLMKYADDKLYRAKEQGRNRVVT